jgi:hypothetical protein
MRQHKPLTAFCLSTLLAASAYGAVSPEEAARLGSDLTPLGAERAGNADGSIPEWDPKGTPVPASFTGPDADGFTSYPSPYPDEKPLYSIDGSNWRKYADNLTAGTQAILEKYGNDGFRLDVYPTKRDFVLPDWFVANVKKNATGATLVADGQKIEGSYPGTPFPIPQSALEVLYNHMIRYVHDFEVDYDVYYVSSSGKPILSTTGFLASVFPMYKDPDKLVGDGLFIWLRINYLAPARRAGEILLVHEPGADFSEGKGRKAWQYLTGQRRVRLAPAVSFDTPNPGVAGTSTYDDSYLWNGSPERYNWTLVGKKEMIIPYSNYDFNFKYKVEDILGEKFLKPESVRWEKHRVWIVEGDLKEGSRHLYSKRRYYIDEDSWTALAGETYDGRNNLWRVHYAYSNNLYDINSQYAFSYGTYDVLQGIYNINSKPRPGRFRNGVTKGDNYFTPKGMARGGVR